MATKHLPLDQLGWDHLRALLEVARGGALAPAARKLGVDQSTISRRLAQVEYSSGGTLFRRDRKGIVLTPFGREVFTRVEKMETALHEIQGLTADRYGQNAGTVSIATMEGVGAMLISRAVRKLHERFAAIEIQLATTSNYVDIARRESDIFVSFFEPPPKSLHTQKVADVHFHLYASASYLAGREIARPEDLAQDFFIGYIDDPIYLPSARWLEEFVDAPRIGFRATSMFSQLFAAQEGLGVVLLPSYAEAESFGLIRLLPDRSARVPLFISVQYDLQYLPHIRAVFDLLAQLMAEKLAAQQPMAPA